MTTQQMYTQDVQLGLPNKADSEDVGFGDRKQIIFGEMDDERRYIYVH